MDYVDRYNKFSDISLEEALTSCKAAASRGYAIAKENIEETNKATEKIVDTLSGCMSSIEGGPLHTPEIATQLREQFTYVVNDLKSLQKEAEASLEERRNRLDKFSITLFGRTMAGKSTLMEILTRGDGTSIGSGAQRTTRDVRVYQWNGLEVTDVPGVAAFEGAQDEELAFEAAARADLILFLITDDSPQSAEAECLAQIRRLGRPVLGICNVKIAMDDEDDLLLFLRDPQRPFDQTRIRQLIQQFYEIVDRYIPGKRVPFIVTHLRSRFLAYQPGFEGYRRKLVKVSRFEAVESRIIREVVSRGAFLRVKNFIDGAVTPMRDFTNKLLEYSAQNSSSGRVLVDKKRQLESWKHDFKISGQERINTLISKMMDSLRNEIPAFSEEHYEDSSAGKSWEQLVKTKNIDHKINVLQNELFNECKKGISDFVRELESEISIVSALYSDRHIKMGSIFDGKRAWNWLISVTSGGLAIAGLFMSSAALAPIAVVVGVAGWLISLFLDDREEKARRAREKLSSQLIRSVNKMEYNLRKKLGDWFHQGLLLKQVDVLLNDLGGITSSLFALADAQRTLAWTLNDRQKNLNYKLVKEALGHLGAEYLLDSVSDVARDPGTSIMLLIKQHTKFPEQIRNDLEKLLGEKIWFAVDTGNKFSILAQAIGRSCRRETIRIEGKIQVVHIPFDNIDEVTKSRICLAQQLVGLHVMR